MIEKNVNLLDLLKNEDVEYKTLGEVGEFIRGNGLQKKDFAATGFPAIHYGQIYTKYGLSADKTFTFVADELAEKLRQAGNNDLLIATTSENDEDVCKSVAWLGGKVAISGDMMIFRHQENVKYLMYYFHSDLFQKEKKKYITGTKVRRVSATDMAKIKIPIPSLEIQQKVVEILDKMTDYVTELTAELTLRQKQYAYYRDQLLTFPSQSDSDESLTVRWLKMGEFGEFIRGNGMQKKDFVESGFPAIHYGQIYTKYGLTADETFTFVTDELASKLKIADKNDLIIATTSENVEDILKPLAWLGGKVAIGGHESLFRHNENVKYLAYYFQTTEFQQMKQKYIVGTKVKDISKENLSNLTVPLPPLKVQSKIVEILDKFDKLTSDLTEGLPREITLRQKQYEYWREQLLSFKKV